MRPPAAKAEKAGRKPRRRVSPTYTTPEVNKLAEIIEDQYSEATHARQLIAWCDAPDTRAKYPMLQDFFHTPNERKMSPKQGHMLNLEGRRAGVADYILMVPSGNYHGLIIELKDMRGVPTDEQVAFLDRHRERGYCAHWVRGWRSARDLIKEYLEGASVKKKYVSKEEETARHTLETIVKDGIEKGLENKEIRKNMKRAYAHWNKKSVFHTAYTVVESQLIAEYGLTDPAPAPDPGEHMDPLF